MADYCLSISQYIFHDTAFLDNIFECLHFMPVLFQLFLVHEKTVFVIFVTHLQLVKATKYFTLQDA